MLDFKHSSHFARTNDEQMFVPPILQGLVLDFLCYALAPIMQNTDMHLTCWLEHQTNHVLTAQLSFVEWRMNTCTSMQFEVNIENS